MLVYFIFFAGDGRFFLFIGGPLFFCEPTEHSRAKETRGDGWPWHQFLFSFFVLFSSASFLFCFRVSFFFLSLFPQKWEPGADCIMLRYTQQVSGEPFSIIARHFFFLLSRRHLIATTYRSYILLISPICWRLEGERTVLFFVFCCWLREAFLVAPQVQRTYDGGYAYNQFCYRSVLLYVTCIPSFFIMAGGGGARPAGARCDAFEYPAAAAAAWKPPAHNACCG